jgi:GWxTD domain-containing protein
MRRPFLVTIAFLALASLVPAQKLAEKDLPERFQDWLKLVAYHVQPVERDVFLQLTSDRERDIFVEMFWKQRDPTPGTADNEYREELEKRFAYVNTFYGRSTSREGWRTDMGRIHMILGPPASVETFEGTLGIVPCVSWSYYGDARKNLPPQFILLFYQRGGVGEFKLYDPVADGPSRLLQNQKDIGDPFDYETLHDKILDLAPTLAEPSITRIPGEYGFNLTPSPRNNILLADILTSPKKDVNPAYASHFLKYKGVVSTEYLTNFVESSALTALIQDPVTGLRFLHFAIVPAAIDVDFYAPKDQFYCNYRVDISLRRGEQIIFQYNREFPLYFPKSDWDRVKASGLAIEDSFPISEGRFQLNVLLTNTVGKQFSILEKDIDVPAAGTGPALEGPFLGYKLETYPRDVHIPFKVADKKLVTDPNMSFGRSDSVAVMINVLNVTEDLLKNGEVRLEVRGLREASPVQKSYAVKLSASPLQRVLSIPQLFPAADLEPDYYELYVQLIGPSGETIDEKKGAFVVSLAPTVGHPIANSKGFALANEYLYLYMLAQQAERLDRAETARALYDRAYGSNPDYKDGVIMYGRFLNATGAFAEALEAAERLKADGRRHFQYLVIRGQALAGQERFEEALIELIEANKIYDSDTNVLNALGRCYFRLGRKAEALNALNASLRLNPDQEAVKKLIQEIER